MPAIRVAVVGHVEWVDFARVERLPLSGEIVHATDAWEEPAGGGGVAAVQLAKLAGEATLFTSLGSDERGRLAREGLGAHGVRIEAADHGRPQRRALTFVERTGERTITTLGIRDAARGGDDLPWDDLARVDAVYFAAGDVEALRAARRARVLVATARVLETLAAARVPVDALVGSGGDPSERYEPGSLDPPPALVVTTAGAGGGTYAAAEGRTGTWAAAPVPGPVGDA